jgi:hypothetical protein
MRTIQRIVLAVICLAGPAGTAFAQTQVVPVGNPGWSVRLYPLFVWIPFNISADVNAPPDDGDDGIAGDILESRFDGAYYGGVAASYGRWWFEGYGLWAAFGGDRPSLPFLTADFDLIYADGRAGYRVAPELYATAGFRRIALNYDISLGPLPKQSGKPGLWDPIFGVAWHRVREKVEWHASFEGGGFGVGTDAEYSTSFRVDWKFTPHFGITGGYTWLYLKLTAEESARTLILKTTLHGPSFGIGLYF